VGDWIWQHKWWILALIIILLIISANDVAEQNALELTGG